MSSKVVPIAGRDPGASLLVCLQCGRYWGMDDLLPPPEEVITERQKGPEGLCPICADEGLEGRVYKIADIEKEIEQEEPQEAA